MIRSGGRRVLVTGSRRWTDTTTIRDGLASVWHPTNVLVHDRDVNAARNILAAGRAERLNACGDQVRPRTGAQVDEAGTHRNAVPA